MEKYQYILFDLDGTLTESHEGIINSVLYALEKKGIHENDREKLMTFVGPPLLDSFMNYYGMTQEEAEELIDLIPTIQAEACHAPTLQALAQHYRTAVQSHDCRDLIELMMSIYAKRRQAEAQKRRLGMVDERYMKQAEQLLHGELAAALGIPMEEVQPYIARRVSGETPSGTAKG